MRWRLIAALAAVLVAGLLSRLVDALPAIVERHAGDTLWATAVVLGLALVFGVDSARAAGFGFTIATCVEFSQLWKPRWLEDLRSNDLAALVLGRGWLWGDIIRYAVGAVLGYIILRTLDRRAVVAPL